MLNSNPIPNQNISAEPAIGIDVNCHIPYSVLQTRQTEKKIYYRIRERLINYGAFQCSERLSKCCFSWRTIMEPILKDRPYIWSAFSFENTDTFNSFNYFLKRDAETCRSHLSNRLSILNLNIIYNPSTRPNLKTKSSSIERLMILCHTSVKQKNRTIIKHLEIIAEIIPIFQRCRHLSTIQKLSLIPVIWTTISEVLLFLWDINYYCCS